LLEEALEKNRNQEITKAKIKQALLKVNRELPSMVGVNSGSTVVLLNIKGEECLTANLGDSQAFLVRGDTITNLTVEHNLAGVMVELGKLSPEQARVHPLRNYLTAFLGMDAKELPVHFAKINLQNDDRILICTDGLTGMVPEETIKNIIKSELDLETAVHKLVDMANQAGGWDNTTLVLVEISKY
jgi:protein phosphatase